jgi:hypothetical protein
MQIKTRIDKRQNMAATLIQYAAGVRGIDYKALTDDEQDELLSLAQGAADQILETDDLIRLTVLIQKAVRLQVYTVQQAAAWLGLSTNAVSAAHRESRLNAMKPGHDLVIPHDELERFNRERRYALA